ncbi:hypothetical protein [Arthrobacter sp. A5]|uniref:hypothetical protein n=1 Tax=Arthrobacter sp. A5 TaxID=576926 RepID=UPI003DA8E970
MQALWIVLTVLTAVGLGWPVTTGMLRLAQEADAQERRARAADGQEADGTQTEHHEADAPGDEGLADAPAGGDPRPPAAREDRLSVDRPPPGVLRGGLVIGLLERAAVVIAILAEQPVAIAYIVAIKGLGRFPELKQSPAASERFIIGTLSSMLWAAAVATLAKWLLLGG